LYHLQFTLQEASPETSGYNPIYNASKVTPRVMTFTPPYTDLIERGWDVGGDDLSHGKSNTHHHQQLSIQSRQSSGQSVPAIIEIVTYACQTPEGTNTQNSDDSQSLDAATLLTCPVSSSRPAAVRCGKVA